MQPIRMDSHTSGHTKAQFTHELSCRGCPLAFTRELYHTNPSCSPQQPQHSGVLLIQKFPFKSRKIPALVARPQVVCSFLLQGR